MTQPVCILFIKEQYFESRAPAIAESDFLLSKFREGKAVGQANNQGVSKGGSLCFPIIWLIKSIFRIC
jgi:hypothetical protein